MKNRKSDKEGTRNSSLEREAIVRRQGSSEEKNCGGKPTLSEADSSRCFGINKSLLENASIQRLLELISQERSLLIDEIGLNGAKAALIALLSNKSTKSILVISGSSDDRLFDDMGFFDLPHLLDFPSWEVLPGEEVAPSPDLVGKRLEVLHALTTQKVPHTLFAPLQAVLQKLPTLKHFKPLSEHWNKGDTLIFHELQSKLESLGYTRTSVVSDKGQFALRGGIIDLFPLSSTDPYRVDFFGDTIDGIRTFDPISQKSTQKVDSLFLTPAFETKKEEKTATLLDYLPPDTLVIFNDLLQIEDHWVLIKKLIESNPSSLIHLDALIQSLSSHKTLFFATEKLESLSSIEMPKRTGRAFYSGKDPLQPLSFEFAGLKLKTQRTPHPFLSIADAFSLSTNLAASSQEEILYNLSKMPHLNLHLLFSTEAEKQAFDKALDIELPSSTHKHLRYLSSGFFLEENSLALLPLTEFSHRLRDRRQKWRSTYHTPAADFHELSIGDVVVHYHQGIAKYLGMEKKTDHKGDIAEFLVLEYANESKLFVPVSQSHLVSRYIGTKEEIPTLHKLGSNRWMKTRSLAQTAITGYASELIKFSAQREVEGGLVYPKDSDQMRLFEEDFPFVETQDQLLAIDDIKKEMQSQKALDRLICGDVGYGKTEVAMRAAMKAVIDGGKQVAVLVPTTVLAMQHFETFTSRMANFPVGIGVLSRFKTAKENKETLKKAQEGSLDIIIGTHRILSKDVSFKNLGLLIIDEEQRFGVRAKEHLRRLKDNVDCLTLSATPIPRTLYLSLVGARNISTINTPPQDRLPIKSIIATKDAHLIKNALLRELSRDGQAYFIHNRVETIFKVTEEIQKLVPEARIVTGHGQMSADELDTVFHAFKQGEADILVATTLIENGIDIPNANTILIDKADTFGLADLYQMRGRVGRWNRPAFAYFLVNNLERLSDLSRKRLNAIAAASGFGAGMKIAMRDLEIRGAGNILGTQQSGEVSSVGFHLYCKLLKKAVDALKKGRSPSYTETKMEFSFDASLPETYINEPSLRMEIYHRLGEAASEEELTAILSELKDRFGPSPPQVLWLYHLSSLRLVASYYRFVLLKFDKRTITAERQVKLKSIKKTLSLPQEKNPERFCLQVVELLKSAFDL